MNRTDNKNLPSRLRESTFHAYEQHIQAAVACFPDVYVVQTATNIGSLVTFSSRFRDAMASLVMYRWTSELVNMDKFDEIYPLIRTSHVMPDRVVIGSAENIKAYYAEQNLPPSQFECLTPIASAKLSAYQSQTIPTTNATGQTVAVSLSQDTHDKGVELKFLAGLAALRLLNSAVEIEITAEIAKSLENNYDVILTSIAENKYTIQ